MGGTIACIIPPHKPMSCKVFWPAGVKPANAESVRPAMFAVAKPTPADAMPWIMSIGLIIDERLPALRPVMKPVVAAAYAGGVCVAKPFDMPFCVSRHTA